MRTPASPRSGAEASARPQMVAPSAQTESVPVLRLTTFPQLVALAGEKRDILTKTAMESDMRLVRFEDGRLEVALERHAARGLVNELSRKLELWTGRCWRDFLAPKWSRCAGLPPSRRNPILTLKT